MPIDLTSFGRAVSSARKAKRLSQKELAAIIKKRMESRSHHSI